MPPCLDVYALSPRRDLETIERFLASYVDVAASADREGQEVAVLPVDFAGDEDDLPLEDWDSIALATLGAVLDFGLDKAGRAFTVYLRASSHDLCGAMLSFTRSGELVYGISVDDPLSTPKATRRARRYLKELCRGTEATHGWVVAEVPPSLDPRAKRDWAEYGVIATYESVK